MKVLFRIAVIAFFSCAPLHVAAAGSDESATLIGTVVDDETDLPLQGVHVFIASSMIGTTTDEAGRFRLDGIPTGAHTVYVSMIGYEPARFDTLFRARTYTIHFRLPVATIEGPEIVVTAERNRAWRRRLERFERLLLGETENAEQATIVNPEVLDFDTNWLGTFAARAAAPVVVENRALGYRIAYHMKEFTEKGGALRYDGEPLFEPLEPADAAEAARWEANRRDAFYGSFEHFMLALLADACEEEGFVIYLLPDKENKLHSRQRLNVDARHLLRDAGTPTERILDFSGALEIIYLREPADDAFLRWMHGTTWERGEPQRSWIELTNGPTTIDHTGEVVDPYGVTTFGHFAFERLADLVPKEYRPDE